MKKILFLFLIFVCVSYPQSKIVSSAWVRGNSSVYVSDYIKDNDTSNGWQDAINAAIENVKSSSGTRSGNFGNTTTEIILPSKLMRITEPIKVYSGITLKGQGASSEIAEKTGFTGLHLIELYGQNNYVDDAVITDLKLTSANKRAIGCGTTTVDVVNCRFQNLTLNTKQGIILDEYTQATRINNIYSYGYVDTLLYLYGNANYVDGIDKEGNSGTSVGYYIYLQDPTGNRNVDGNVLRNILIEGNCSPNKGGMYFEGVDITTLDGYWYEANNSNGYMLTIAGSERVNIKGHFTHLSTNRKLKIDSTQYVAIDELSTDATQYSLYDYIEKDSSSTLFIDRLHTRGYYSPYRLDKLSNGYVLKDVFSKIGFSLGSPEIISPVYKPKFTGNNLFPEKFESQLLDFDPGLISNLYMWFEGDSGLSSSSWVDQSDNGYNMTFHNSPTLGTNNGIPSIIFDGIDQYGATDTVDLYQPTTVYLLFKPITHNSNNTELILGCTTVGSSANFFTTPSVNKAYALNAGSQIGVVGITQNEFNLVKIVLDSADSYVQINNGGKQTGNAGNHDLLGIALAHNFDTTYTNMEVSAVLVFDKVLSEYEGNLVNDYLKNKYNLIQSDWVVSPSTDTADVVASEISAGETQRFVWNTPQSIATIYRPFVITDGMVGKQLTFSVNCKVDANSSFAAPYVSGCGITPESTMRVYPEGGWYSLTVTFTPQSAGNINIGVWAFQISEIKLENPYLTGTVQ